MNRKIKATSVIVVIIGLFASHFWTGYFAYRRGYDNGYDAASEWCLDQAKALNNDIKEKYRRFMEKQDAIEAMEKLIDQEKQKKSDLRYDR